MKAISTVALGFLVCFLLPSLCPGEKKPVTVEDIIETTRLADVDYFWGRPSDGKVAQYSPDGQHFVIVLRKGNLEKNTNVYSIYLFTTKTIFDSSAPRLLLSMSSSSNRPAIRQIKWLADNKTLAFAGEREGGRSQVFTVNTITRQLRQRTGHPTSVDRFDISPDGQEILFTAEKTQDTALTQKQQHDGYVVQNQTLADVLAGRFNYVPGEEQLFYQKGQEESVPIPRTHQINTNSRVTFSPNGRFALVTAYFREPSGDWTAYNNPTLQYWGSRSSPLQAASPISQYFLFTSPVQSVRPLLDAPAVYSAKMQWAKDSHAVFLQTFLPLNGQTGQERVDRAGGELRAEISIPELGIRRLSSDEWQRAQPVQHDGLPSITLKESANTPPKVYAHDESTDRNTMLFDLNPQFAELELGRVEDLTFSVHGIPVIAGLYLPPHYVTGKRYPLVVQTHGYDPSRFSMDGRYEWSSGFAARALAAGGMIVVQMEDFKNREDHDRVGSDRSLGTTLQESFRTFAVLAYEEVIRYLSGRGMVDSDRVGISGFSRTVWFVAYTLTHSRKHFRAAALTDGISGGYFEYIAAREVEFDVDNGGLSPFGKEGLEQWMKESPGFNLDMVRVPTRLVAIGDPTSEWEWFVARGLQKKPVEMMLIPGGVHMLEKPQNRYVAMQGIVDWFRFWLQDYEYSDRSKKDQYKRWEHLRELQDADDKTTGQPQGNPVKPN